jgi:hypothetical protein
MKNHRNPTTRRSTKTSSSFSGRGDFQGETPNRAVAEGGRVGSSFHDPICAAKALKLETTWQADAVMVLPEQFFRPGGASHAVWTGERRLLLAVLEEALESFFRYRNTTTRRGQRLFNETIEWFWDRDQEWLYSFETICQHLDLDAEYIRGGLQRLYETETDEKTLAFSARAGKRRRQTNRSFAHAA